MKNPRILIVDGMEAMRFRHGRLLKRLGCWCALAGNVPQAKNLLAEHEFALALIEVNLPETSGIELASHITRSYPDTAILMLTEVNDPLLLDAVLDLGAYGYLLKPLECNDLLINVSGALRRRSIEIQNRKQRDRLEHLIVDGAFTLHESLNRLNQAGDTIGSDEEQTIFQIARMAEFREYAPGKHLQNIASYSAMMVSQLGGDEAYCRKFQLASVLHDLGKIVIPETVLFREGQLSRYEFEMVKRHCEFGHRMLTGRSSELLKLADTIAWSHHERFDGAGYPRGLAGEAIPLEGRIVAIADVYDALNTPRSYRPAVPPNQCIERMQQLRDRHFDPQLLDSFLEGIAKVNEKAPEQNASLFTSNLNPVA